MIAINLAPMKKCEGCGLQKALCNYRRNKSYGVAYGWSQKCYACINRDRMARGSDPNKGWRERAEKRRVEQREHSKDWYSRRMADPTYRAARNEHGRRWKIDNAVKYMFATVRYSARRRGLEFDLRPEDIVIPDVCPVLGIPLVPRIGKGVGFGPRDSSPSIDRIDNSKGYVRGNVHVISNRANRIKNDASLEEMRRWVAYLEKL